MNVYPMLYFMQHIQGDTVKLIIKAFWTKKENMNMVDLSANLLVNSNKYIFRGILLYSCHSNLRMTINSFVAYLYGSKSCPIQHRCDLYEQRSITADSRKCMFKKIYITDTLNNLNTSRFCVTSFGLYF